MYLLQNSYFSKWKRHHVHLSPDSDTTRKVGARYGKPVILAVDTVAMLMAGYAFRLSDNGVWLIDAVPLEYLRVISDD